MFCAKGLQTHLQLARLFGRDAAEVTVLSLSHHLSTASNLRLDSRMATKELNARPRGL